MTSRTKSRHSINGLSNMYLQRSGAIAVAAALLLLSSLLPSSSEVQARDDLITLPVAALFDNPEYAAKLEGVQFFFGSTPYPAVAKDHGEFTSNKKTNAFKKDDQFACNWALLSALLAFKDRALGLGADAVVGIRSFYKNNDFRADTDYQCGAGNIMAGVTMKGTIVKFQ